MPWMSDGPRTEVIIFPNDDGSCQAWCNNTMGDGDAYWEGWHSPMQAKSWWQTPAPSWTLIGYHAQSLDGTTNKQFWAKPNGYVHRTVEGELRMYDHATLKPEGSTTSKGKPLFDKSTSKGKPSSSSPEGKGARRTSKPKGKGARRKGKGASLDEEIPKAALEASTKAAEVISKVARLVQSELSPPELEPKTKVNKRPRPPAIGTKVGKRPRSLVIGARASIPVQAPTSASPKQASPVAAPKPASASATPKPASASATPTPASSSTTPKVEVVEVPDTSDDEDCCGVRGGSQQPVSPISSPTARA